MWVTAKEEKKAPAKELGLEFVLELVREEK